MGELITRQDPGAMDTWGGPRRHSDMGLVRGRPVEVFMSFRGRDTEADLGLGRANEDARRIWLDKMRSSRRNSTRMTQETSGDGKRDRVRDRARDVRDNVEDHIYEEITTGRKETDDD